MYEMISALQARGFSNDIIVLFEQHDRASAKDLFNKMMKFSDDQIQLLNQHTEARRSLSL